jgi:hypothetical protein
MITGCCGTVIFGAIELPDKWVVTAVLVALAVLLIAWDWIKPLLSWLGGAAKSLVPKPSQTTTTKPGQTLSASDRVKLWEQLYDACDPTKGACPKAQELLNQVFPHLAPYHAEAPK